MRIRGMELQKEPEGCSVGRIQPAVAGFEDENDHELRMHVSRLLKLEKAREHSFLGRASGKEHNPEQNLIFNTVRPCHAFDLKEH